MDVLINALSWVLLMGGVFLGFSGVLGLYRFPDFYTRVHAASVTDTLSALCIIAGLVLQAGFTLISVKLGLVLLLLWYTGPVASHALVRSAHLGNLQPLLGKQATTGRAESSNS
ncbi:monovalent cation/H(+) antiporter subunit G [Thiothrix winogradskyi]|uniref:Monovalent cation/H(+) antiporter subunit G n=1 Tax=Thiothrix winogradskyi TaxID=96472 RepID=A0ABY3T5X7_9GAMM|nr:monovalent cation/H(+) antiporter subunit G [Thiothrix winogradskyi]UJS26094.1 monovalent cation/H(+) antiporter subunit G [Thiothrix winogradskyi]